MKKMLLILAVFGLLVSSCQKEEVGLDSDALFEEFKKEHLPEGAEFVKSNGEVPSGITGKTDEITEFTHPCGVVYWNYEQYKVSLYTITTTGSCQFYLIGRDGGGGKDFFYVAILNGQEVDAYANHDLRDYEGWTLVIPGLIDVLLANFEEKPDFVVPIDAGITSDFYKSDDITTTASITNVSDHPTGIEGSLDSFYIGFEPTDYVTGVFRNTDVTFERGDYIVIHQPARPEIDLQDVYTLAQVSVVHYDAIEYSIITDNGYRFDRQVEIHKVHQN